MSCLWETTRDENIYRMLLMILLFAHSNGVLIIINHSDQKCAIMVHLDIQNKSDKPNDKYHYQPHQTHKILFYISRDIVIDDL